MIRVRSRTELETLKTSWKSLEKVTPGVSALERPSVFQSWEWNRCWVDTTLEDGDSGELDVRVFSRGDAVVAILPFYAQSLVGPIGRVLQFLGHRMSYHNDALLSPATTEDELDEIVELLQRSLAANEIVHLRHLYEPSRFTQKLIQKGMATRQCRRVLLEDDPSRPEPEDRLGKSSRRSLKNRRNRLMRDHDCGFVLRTGAELGPFFDRFLDLHHRRFESIGKDSVLGEVPSRFLREVIQAPYEAVMFEGLELRNEERVVASALLAKDGDMYFNLNFGFDPEFNSYSPMVTLLAETIRRGFREHGCSLYDLGPGYEAYKLAWDPVERANFFSCFGGRQASARLIAAAYKKAFQRALPPDAER